MPDPLETRITGVQEAHLQIRDAHGLVRCLCGGWLAVMPGGSPGDDRAHRAHVAAEIARALGAETRVEAEVGLTNKKRGLVSEADVALLREAFMAALERARAEAFQAETQEREGSE